MEEAIGSLNVGGWGRVEVGEQLVTPSSEDNCSHLEAQWRVYSYSSIFPMKLVS